MITVMLVNMSAEVQILRYDTDSEEEACQLLIDDWKIGKVKWELCFTNEAFSREWLEKYGMDPMGDNYTPQYENEVRMVEWYCVTGPKESDDEIVWGYFLHTTNRDSTPMTAAEYYH